MNGRIRARDAGLFGCPLCGLVCEAAPDNYQQVRCPRCRTSLHHRRPDSLVRALAFLIAAVIFYVPANILPVMYTTQLGRGSDSTIMQGVISFWKVGSYEIALLIFVASVVVPCTKFLVLALLIVTARRGSAWARHERAKLYRVVELIGYWSMLDVLVVAIVAALVKFQSLADVQPRLGILFFCGMVILTMVAAMQFDPRLIWDGKNT